MYLYNASLVQLTPEYIDYLSPMYLFVDVGIDTRADEQISTILEDCLIDL